MPIVSVDHAWLSRLLGKDYDAEQLGDALDLLGCDVEDVTETVKVRCPSCALVSEVPFGADTVKLCPFCDHADEAPFPEVGRGRAIRLDLLAARPDLFDIGGLARALKGFLEHSLGLPDYTVAPGTLTVHVDPALGREESYRPFIRCAVVRLPPLDDAMLLAIMKLQENLHWGVGRDRKLASIGVYDLDAISGGIRYRTLHPDDEPFVPLDMPGRPMSGRAILAEHPKGVRYAHLLADHQRYPVLVDERGLVLSMPPIINSDATRLKPGSRNLFIDVTGVSEAAVVKSLDTLVCSLVELGGAVESVRLETPDGARVSPDLTPRTLEVGLGAARRWLGLPLDADSLVHSLRKMRLDVEPLDEERTRFRVRYPAFRTDIKHMVDVFEDLAIGFGYDRIEPRLVPTQTVGRPRPEEEVSATARTALIGLSFSEIMSLPMATEEEHFTRLRLPVPSRYVEVANPKLKAMKVIRGHLLGGLLSALHENRRRPLPLKLFELDNVVYLDEAGETGTREDRVVALVEMGLEVGYASMRAMVDALMRELGLELTYRAAESPSFVPGRYAELLAGEVVRGRVGELHPEVITGCGLDHPVAVAEIQLVKGIEGR